VVVILAGSGAATTDLEQLQSACIAEDLFDNLYVSEISGNFWFRTKWVWFGWFFY